MKKTAKKMPLAAFVDLHGRTPAAALCGVTVMTLWRWMKKRTRPSGNDARRLEELGIEVSA